MAGELWREKPPVSRLTNVQPSARERVIRDWEGEPTEIIETTIETEKHIPIGTVPAGTTVTQEMIQAMLDKVMRREAEEIEQAFRIPSGHFEWLTRPGVRVEQELAPEPPPRRYDNPNAIDVEYHEKKPPKGELPAGE